MKIISSKFILKEDYPHMCTDDTCSWLTVNSFDGNGSVLLIPGKTIDKDILEKVVKYISPFMDNETNIQFVDEGGNVFRYVFYEGKSLLQTPIWGKPKELRVNTQFGDVVAYPSDNHDYPGISIMFKPDGYDTEIDFAYVESKEGNDVEGHDSENLYLYTYVDEYSEDYTHCFRVNTKKIKESFE